MVSDVGGLVRRLRARRGEIVDAVFVHVREVVPDAVGDMDVEYVAGLRAAVAAAVEFGLAGIEQGEQAPLGVPREVGLQARRAARSGVSLEAVLRRYIVGHALLWDYVMQEAERLQRGERALGLRGMLSVQASLLDRLVIGVTREHVAEFERAGRSREYRLLERVRLLLADTHRGASVDALGLADLEAEYDLDGEHLCVIASGAGVREMLQDLAARFDRRLLSVSVGKETVWAWLGGRDSVDMELLLSALSVAVGERERNRGRYFAGEIVGSTGRCFSVAVGEPASGLAGWRETHGQAQAALLVAQRRPAEHLTRFADVLLLTTALKDRASSRALGKIYLEPLDDYRGSGPVLRQTLRAYIAAEHNISSAAAKLKVARTTVVNRLHTVEERLGRTLHPCPAELEVALELDDLDATNMP